MSCLSTGPASATRCPPPCQPMCGIACTHAHLHLKSPPHFPAPTHPAQVLALLVQTEAEGQRGSPLRHPDSSGSSRGGGGGSRAVCGRAEPLCGLRALHPPPVRSAPKPPLTACIYAWRAASMRPSTCPKPVLHCCDPRTLLHSCLLAADQQFYRAVNKLYNATHEVPPANRCLLPPPPAAELRDCALSVPCPCQHAPVQAPLPALPSLTPVCLRAGVLRSPGLPCSSPAR